MERDLTQTPAKIGNYYPTLVLVNPTQIQADIFIETAKAIQGLRMMKAKILDSSQPFDCYGKFEQVVDKDGTVKLYYMVNDYKLYYTIARMPKYIDSMFEFTAHTNGKITKLYPNYKEEDFSPSEKTFWIDVNGGEIPLHLQPLCTLHNPSLKDIKAFNEAVEKELDYTKVFSLYAINNGLNVDYYLSKNDIEKHFINASHIDSIRRAAISNGLNVLSEKAKKSFVFYDEVGNKNSHIASWASPNMQKYCERFFPENEIDDSNKLQYIKEIAKQAETPDDFRPVLVLESTKSDIIKKVLPLLKKFLISSNYQKFRTDFINDIDVAHIEKDNKHYYVCSARTLHLQNFFIQHSPAFYKTMKNMPKMTNNIFSYTINSVEDCIPAQYLPLCTLNKLTTLPEDITSALSVLKSKESKALEFRMLEKEESYDFYVTFRSEHSTTNNNLSYMRDIKQTSLSALKNAKIIFHTLEDNGVITIGAYNKVNTAKKLDYEVCPLTK